VLEIFAERAMTEESKLQIELAQLIYERPRERLRLMHKLGLEGAWHTERSGFWGPGETPLNVFDATMTKKESYLKTKLNLLKQQRENRRQKRKRYYHDSLYVSIVGYTSAGKSTIICKKCSGYHLHRKGYCGNERPDFQTDREPLSTESKSAKQTI